MNKKEKRKAELLKELAERQVSNAGEELIFSVLDYRLPDYWDGVRLHAKIE